MDKTMDDAKSDTNATLTIDLTSQSITGLEDGEVKFAIDPLRKHYLLNGIGAIGLTMETEAATTGFGAPLSKPALN